MQGLARLPPLVTLTALALLLAALSSAAWAKGPLTVSVPPGSANAAVAVKIIKAQVKRKYVFVKLAVENNSAEQVEVYRDLIILQPANGTKRGPKVAKRHQVVGPHSSKKILGLKYYDVDLKSPGYSLLFTDASVLLGGEPVQVAPAELMPAVE